MNRNNAQISILDEIIVDNFAGGGGASTGIELAATVEVRPYVNLQPFRTFLEVAQPESMFLLRLKEGGNVGLFEADGGVWRLEATRNIAGYFEENLKELVESGRVVVLR